MFLQFDWQNYQHHCDSAKWFEICGCWFALCQLVERPLIKYKTH